MGIPTPSPSMSLPSELQVLCRRLASTDAADLPSLCSSLVGHIQRCESVLSLPVDQKPKDGAPGHAVLVHKLKTQITTLLNNGRSQPGRFAAAILIKAVVEVGGYESLRTSEPWVRGLLTMVQVRPTSPPPPPANFRKHIAKQYSRKRTRTRQRK